MNVLAIDPGYGRCGVAVLEGDGSRSTLLTSACIETSAKLPFPERLLAVGTAIAALIDTYHPDAVAIEELFFTNNAKTALHVAEVRGMIMFIAASKKVTLVEYNPVAIKIALTGYGRANKEQVTKMVEQILRLDTTAMIDDECDAIAVGLTALASAKYTALQGQK